MANAKPGAERPLSPHLQIYKPLLTMMMSIVHRMTGAALYLGTLLLAWWLLATASGPEAFATAQGVMGSVVGQLILFGYTWALIHHMLGGVKHLAWDLGHGFEPATADRVAALTIAGSIVLTLFVWAVGWWAW